MHQLWDVGHFFTCDLPMIAVGTNCCQRNWCSFSGNYSKICLAFAKVIAVVGVVNFERMAQRLMTIHWRRMLHLPKPLCFVRYFDWMKLHCWIVLPAVIGKTHRPLLQPLPRPTQTKAFYSFCCASVMLSPQWPPLTLPVVFGFFVFY